ncbi:MAG: magnesium transporter [Bacteroidales bacterium]|nr:magnesium transporter [Bacteroidales bacterium]
MAKWSEISKDFFNDLRTAIEAADEKKALTLIQGLHAADIAEIYDEISTEEARFLYLLLDKETAADTLAELDEDDREEFLKHIPSDVIAHQFIDNMDTDDAADVIADLSEKKQQEVLKHIDDIDHSGDIVDLLSYDEDTAGGLMAKELVVVNINWTVLTCLKELGRQADEVDEVYYLYVIDDDRLLKGIVSLKDLAISKNATIISKIMESDIHFVTADDPAEEVAQMMEKYDLVAVPVVDAIGRLIGRITIDDIVDVIREEAERDYQLASGLTEDVEHSDRVFRITRARLPWLFIGMVGGILGALVLGRFEGDLKIYPEMAFFIPLIAAMGGNVGIQSSAIIVQGLANNTYKFDDMGGKLGKEFLVAFLNASILALLVFGYNLMVSDSFALTITVSAALMAVIIFAAMFGTLIPLLLSKFDVDPALATGPFITTMNDIIGLFIYMIMGRILYGVFA